MPGWLRKATVRLSALGVAADLPPQWQQISATHYQLRFGDEAILVELKRPRLTKRATVRAHGQGIVVCVPPSLSERSVQITMLAFEPWILNQWTNMVAFADPVLVPWQTASLPLFGQQLPVQWIRSSRVNVRVADGVWQIHVPEHVGAAQVGSALRQFYEAQSRNRLAPLLNRLAPGMPKMPQRIRFKRVRSIWGSMNSKGVLTIEHSLAIAPEYVFEYLVVHELCHLLEMNHSRAFWRQVALRCPDFQHAEKFLKERGNLVRLNYDRITDPDRFSWRQL